MTTAQFSSRDEFAEALRLLEPHEREAILAEAEYLPRLAPQKGPQHMAYHHPATVTGYGGAAGGGKSALLTMAVMQQHERSIIYRADASQVKGILDEIARFIGTVSGRSLQDKRWTLPGGRLLEWDGLLKPDAEKKQQGRARDFIGVDEATEIPRHKVEFVMSWLRTTTVGQRVRAIFTFNPPGGTKTPGVDPRWVIDYFKAWIMLGYENKAPYGETRYFIRTEAESDVEVDSPDPIVTDELKSDGTPKIIVPESRTFIHARVTDNAFLMGTGYEDRLRSLGPAEYARLYEGDFASSIEDSDYQVFPSRWVYAAMARWEKSKNQQRMSALGVDVARGGIAQTLISPRHGWHWDTFIKVPGRECIDGPDVRNRVLLEHRDDAVIVIDANGNGASPYDLLKSMPGLEVIGSVGSVTKGREWNRLVKIEDVFGFYNMRSLLHWVGRKVLDPANGLEASIPNDPRLRRQLLAPTFEVVGGRVKVEPKENLEEQLGTTLDEIDAWLLTLACAWLEPGFARILSTRSRKAAQRRLMPAQAEENAKRPVYGRYQRRRGGGGLDPTLLM